MLVFLREALPRGFHPDGCQSQCPLTHFLRSWASRKDRMTSWNNGPHYEKIVSWCPDKCDFKVRKGWHSRLGCQMWKASPGGEEARANRGSERRRGLVCFVL